MGTSREQNPLVAFLAKQHRRLLDAIAAIGNGEGGDRITEVRQILSALRDAETEVLYPVFSKVTLDLATERLLEDSRGDRAIQLEKLDALAHKRAPMLRKLGAVALADAVEHHHRAHATRLVPFLWSRLPRPIYGALVNAFIARFEGRPANQRAASEAGVRQRMAS